MAVRLKDGPANISLGGPNSAFTNIPATLGSIELV